MEFLLVNHPLDCPICDQGGECDLQVSIVRELYVDHDLIAVTVDGTVVVRQCPLSMQCLGYNQKMYMGPNCGTCGGLKEPYLTRHLTMYHFSLT